MDDRRDRSRLFAEYVIPSIGSMLVTSLYVVADGVFVGRGIGKNALGAVNIAGPWIMTVIAVTMMLTVGGATMCAVSLGMGSAEKANKYFNMSMALVLAFSGLMTAVTVLFPRQAVRLLGANAALEEDAACYLKWFVAFCVFFCSSSALAAFVRCDGAPGLAFWGMIAGGVSNIFLDWLFIFPLHMGIAGPAVASGLGQSLSCAILLTHFIRKKGCLRFGKARGALSCAAEIARRGTPEFMNQLFQPVTVLCYNLIAMKIYGETGVSAFSAVYYILTVTVAVFTGLSQGIQPLISRSFGGGSREDERFYLRRGAVCSVLLALGVYAAMLFGGRGVISIFSGDSRLIGIGYGCIRVYGLSFLFTAVNTVAITYLTSTKRTGRALALSAARCLVFIPLFAFAFPAMLGSSSPWTVWGGITAAEAASLALAAALMRRSGEKSAACARRSRAV